MVTVSVKSASRTVLIERDGPLAFIRGMPREMAGRLRAPIVRPVPRADGHIIAERSFLPLLRARDLPARGGPVHVCAAGLVPLVVRLLTRNGHPVRICGNRPAPLGPPDLRRTRWVDLDPLREIAARDHLVVRHGPGVTAAAVALMVVRAWPDSRVVLAEPGVDGAREARDMLAANRIAAAIATHRHVARDDARVVVCTHGQLGRTAVGLHDLDFLIIADAVAALGSVPRSTLIPEATPGSNRVPRVLGMIALGRRLAPADRVGVTELCGPFYYEMRTPEIGVRRVTTCSINT